MRALVLSGGGAKGAYEIGVWKALRKLHIKYDLVTGTSVGALNGALFVQGDYQKAYDMWRNMNFNLIFAEGFSDKIMEQGTFELVKAYMKGILKSGGMDVSRLEETMDEFISPEKFYKSKVDFGMVTVNLSTLKPMSLTKKEIPEDKLHDYLMASATCFPAFKIKNIDGQKFVDGGYYDNLPINLAISMGASEVIAVDLDAVGFKRKKKEKKIPVTLISPRNEIGNFLVFDKSLARKAICYGYNDTMKVYGKFDGNVFTFKKYHIPYHTFKYTKKMRTKLLELENRNSLFMNELLKISTIQKFQTTTNKQELNELHLENLEYLGKIFGLEESLIYTIPMFRSKLKEKVKETKSSIANLEKKVSLKDLEDVAHKKTMILYLYSLMMEDTKESKVKKALVSMAFLLHKDFLAALYLTTL